MSIHYRPEIECDSLMCSKVKQYSTRAQPPSIKALRAEAKKEGWIVRRCNDFCPNCAQRWNGKA